MLFTESCGPLFLTVSAVSHHRLVINWHFTCKQPPDRIILYNGKSVLKDLRSISKKGIFVTNVMVSSTLPLPGNWNKGQKNPKKGSHCFSYNIVAFRKDKRVDSNCLKIEPTWMENFGELNIGSMMIPGTHNSGAWISMFGYIGIFYLNQNHNLWNQLVHGIRFFDLRVGSVFGRFFIVHNFMPITPLSQELEHVQEFLSKTTQEIVILNFHQFRWDNHHVNHRILVSQLKERYGPFILSYKKFKRGTLGPKLKDVWKTGKRLIISYNNARTFKEHDWLWPEVFRKWGNKWDINQLYKYLKNVRNYHKHPGSPMCVLMAQQTGQTGNFLKSWWPFLHFDLPSLSDKFNAKIDHWLRFQGWLMEVNIVAVDHYESSDIIAISIEANNKKKQRQIESLKKQKLESSKKTETWKKQKHKPSHKLESSKKQKLKPSGSPPKLSEKTQLSKKQKPKPMETSRLSKDQKAELSEKVEPSQKQKLSSLENLKSSENQKPKLPIKPKSSEKQKLKPLEKSESSKDKKPKPLKKPKPSKKHNSTLSEKLESSKEQKLELLEKSKSPKQQKRKLLAKPESSKQQKPKLLEKSESLEEQKPKLSEYSESPKEQKPKKTATEVSQRELECALLGEICN
ncbi:hypothetical protein ILUMI_01304 [Ignelater luminosus]|uniref:Uncharacterized protein n=1 Tax=Ignelater luminosus TaxID=2038154 RepID=A0A8K0DIM1_IGNLU|nr:hypothetical protein ILUMI_01304 [Ignelater luminosus]